MWIVMIKSFRSYIKIVMHKKVSHPDENSEYLRNDNKQGLPSITLWQN